MKKISFIIAIICLSMSCFSCNREYMYPNYDGNEKEDTIPTNPEEPGDNALKTTIRDLVLIYGGGSDRTQSWTKDAFYPYVSYENNGADDWMFDGFLFLELHDNNGHAFTTGHAPNPALKIHWQELIDKYFRTEVAISGLNNSIADMIAKAGQPDRKRKVIMGIPEPMKGATEWGEIEGKMMDFSKDEDRITACKWFIDKVKEKFDQGNYTNLELEGFYWIAEEVDNTGTMISSIGEYLKEKEFTFIWIPWWKSPGYDNYEQYGFTDVYLQPNYFFYEVPYSRLQDACDEAKTHKINLEVEFNESVLGGNGQKLYDYLEVFEQNDVYEAMKLAYYQSENTILKLYQSVNPADKELYNLFCEIITKRQKAENPSYIE